MNNSIRQRLLSVEGDLLFAVTQDASALEAFQSTWSALKDDIDVAIRMDSIDEQTLTLVHATASTVACFTERFLDLHTVSNSISHTLKIDMEAIFERATLADDTSAITKECPQMSGMSFHIIHPL